MFAATSASAVDARTRMPCFITPSVGIGTQDNKVVVKAQHIVHCSFLCTIHAYSQKPGVQWKNALMSRAQTCRVVQRELLTQVAYETLQGYHNAAWGMSPENLVQFFEFWSGGRLQIWLQE